MQLSLSHPLQQNLLVPRTEPLPLAAGVFLARDHGWLLDLTSGVTAKASFLSFV